MELVTPDIGLFFWMTLVFLVLLFILRKFAWKPIMKALADREASIDDALQSAERAKQEMANLEADNKKLLQEARQEREKMLKEAEAMKDRIVNEAKEKAEEEAKKIVTSARETIRNERQAVVSELKDQIAVLSLEIAGKILKEEMADKEKHKQLMDKLLDDVNIN